MMAGAVMLAVAGVWLLVQATAGELAGRLLSWRKDLPQPSAGAAPLVAPSGSGRGATGGGVAWPVRGTISSPFGPRGGKPHEGLDISCPNGTPVWAAKAGRVIFAAYNDGYGNQVDLDHGGGLTTRYAHLQSFNVRLGETVAAGQVIAFSDNTGSSSGPHLHFEVRVNGRAENPINYLPSGGPS